MKPSALDSAEYVQVSNEYDQLDVLVIQKCDAVISGQAVRRFIYQCIMFYLIDLEEETVLLAAHEISPLLDAQIGSILDGQDSNLLALNSFLFGSNSMEFDVKSYWRLFRDEIAHPFNVFQIVSVLIWFFEAYYMYSLVILFMSGTSITLSLLATKRNSESLLALTRNHSKVKIVHQGQIRELDSCNLVPGHVLIVNSLINVCPCDIVIIKGDAIVDESMLTGESVPVSKVSANFSPEDGICQEFAAKNASSVIYGGTKVLRARHGSKQSAIAIVVKTGFQTVKGNLIRSILFPKPASFNFYADSIKFVIILGFIAAFGFAFSLYSQITLGASAYYIISRALDLITVVVPPALPATMSVGTVFSLNRLKKKLIHCICPSKINVASKVEVFCFDKTGTLTEDGLDLFGAVVALTGPESILLPNHQLRSCSLIDSSRLSSLNQCMALCHSLQKIEGILVGDPLDVKMFESSGWILEEHHNTILRAIARPAGSEAFAFGHLDSLADMSSLSTDEIGIIRCMDFHSDLRRMSVITKALRSDTISAYSKGSPESILSICRPESVPADFYKTLMEYSKCGFRMIACARKEFPDISWTMAQRLDRARVESEMIFIGFLLFENRLKKQSPSCISKLFAAKIPCIMVTGDNLLTSVCVARSCGIIYDEERIFLAPAETCRDGQKMQDYDSDSTICLADVILQPPGTVLAVTGEFLKYLLKMENRIFQQTILRRCRVFARMSPDEKKGLVELYQSFGLSVGFCGDGANDCGALKAADVGISLSNSEASIAAPFSSNVKNITCVISVLLEGRAALVTSFACFKFMALYSMIQFTTLIILYCLGSSLGDYQFIFIDLFLIVPLGMLMSRFEPASELVPGQPETKLISISVLSSLLSQIVYQAVAQFFIFASIYWNSAYSAPIHRPDRPNIESPHNTALFLFSNFLYLSTAFIFCSWSPFRALYAPFYLFVLLALSFNLYWIFGANTQIRGILELTPLTLTSNMILLFCAIIHFLVSLMTELLKPRIIFIIARMFNPRKSFKFKSVLD